MRSIAGHARRPFVVAIALISVATALRLWPLHSLGARLAWLTYYPAVMIASFYGGFSAGLLGTILSCLAVFFVLPVVVDQPFIRDSSDYLGMGVFVTTCTMISGVSEAMHRARARARKAIDQFEASNRELERGFRIPCGLHMTCRLHNRLAA
jgi:K+-sensing histidine kinase KdpD